MSSLIATSRELVEKKKMSSLFLQNFYHFILNLDHEQCERKTKINENKDMKLKLDDETETRQ
jgi:hypothetical protein